MIKNMERCHARKKEDGYEFTALCIIYKLPNNSQTLENQGPVSTFSFTPTANLIQYPTLIPERGGYRMRKQGHLNFVDLKIFFEPLLPIYPGYTSSEGDLTNTPRMDSLHITVFPDDKKEIYRRRIEGSCILKGRHTLESLRSRGIKGVTIHVVMSICPYLSRPIAGMRVKMGALRLRGGYVSRDHKSVLSTIERPLQGVFM